MKNEQFLRLRDELDLYCTDLLGKKKVEYSGERDRLDQFVKAALLLDTTEEKALCGMLVKHITSIFDMATIERSFEKVYTIDQWKEKIGDARNYLDLLWAIVNSESIDNEVSNG